MPFMHLLGPSDGGVERDLADAGIVVESVHYTADGKVVLVMDNELLETLAGFRDRARRRLNDVVEKIMEELT